jgi:asparagine synthase (glutamine-hydrolysing)
MLDGQGSDEQLAGYGGNDAALYTGLLRRLAISALVGEVAMFRRRHGSLPLAQLILAARNVVPGLDALLPSRVRLAGAPPDWVTLDVPSLIDAQPPRDLHDSLVRQTLSVSLPALLRYEDRNSMAWSIESRVPFLDYRLVELLAGLPDEAKLRRGVTKVVLRDALKGIIPESVRARTDKMGFVTPEEVWLRQSARTWFRRGVEEAIEICPHFFNRDRLLKLVDDMIFGKTEFSFLPWRVLCFGRWVDRQNREQRLQRSEPRPAA